MLLNKANLEKIIKDEKYLNKTIYCDNVDNLAITIGKKNVRFIARKTYKKIPYNITIGYYPNISIMEAKERCHKAIGEILDGKHTNNRNENKSIETFNDLFDFYCKVQTSNDKESLNQDIDNYRRYIKSHIGNINIEHLNKQIFLNTLEKLMDRKTTHNRTLSLLSTILNISKNHGYINENFVEGIKKFKETSRIRFLSKAEEKTIKNALTDKRYDNSNFKLFINIAMTTGLRKSDILSIENDNIDLTNKIILVEKTKNGMDNCINLTPNVINLIKEKQKTYKEKSKYLFNNKDYDGHIKNIRSPWATLLRNTNIEDLTPHDLRHDFACRLARNGIPAQKIMNAMGHKSISVTMKYIHLFNDDIKDEVLNVVDNIEM